MVAGAAALLFFINLWAAAAFWAGCPLPFDAAAVLGMASALIVVGWRRKQVAEGKASGRAVRLAAFLLLSLPLYLWIRTHVGHDWLCHIPLTGSIGRGNLPVRDLASPGRLLPYHYGFDVLAGAFLRLARLAAPGRHVESALDATSWAALVLLLAAAWAWWRGFNAGLPEEWRVGRGEMILAMILMLCGGGLVFLGKFLDPSVETWRNNVYAACHPLPLFIGRRPTPLGQAFFLFQMAALPGLRDPARRRPAAWASLAVSNAALWLTSEDLAVASALVALGLLLSPAWRAAARFFLGAAAAALAVAAIQGGLLTALVFHPGGAGVAGWRIRPPFMPGWGLGEPGWGQGRFWAAWLAEFPVALWLLPAAGLAARFQKKRLPPEWKALAACAGLFLLLPLFVQARFSPNDLHRLFFLPQMISLLMLPLHLRILLPRPAWRTPILALVAALLVAGPLPALRAEVRRFDALYGPGWQPDLALPLPADRFERGAVWLVSTRYLPALHYNGLFALSAPFGMYGPNYFKIYPAQHEEWLARCLEDPVRFGATRALLSREDAARLRANGAPFRAEDVIDSAGEPAVLAFFSNGSGP